MNLDFYQSDFMKKALAKARAQARAEVRAEARAEGETRQAVKDVLDVLDQRGIDVPPETRERIAHCGDPELLHTWLLRAVTAASLDEVIG